MKASDIRQLIQDDFAECDRVIKQSLSSNVPLIEEIGHYITDGGGKRMRASLALLCAKALGYQGKKHAILAAIIELIHTATLLHDDVVDESDMRRGKPTANKTWDNAASVLTGDFLYSRSFELMIQLDDMRVMQILAQASNQIAEGEVQQLVNCNNPDTNEASYMQVIQNKTATLFMAACRIPGLFTHSAHIQELADYGMHLGTAFQLVDDIMDYTASSLEMGKNIGDDLAEGKPTLPLIYAMQQGSQADAEIIREAIRHGSKDQLSAIQVILEKTGAIELTKNKAKQEAEKAKAKIAFLPGSEYKQALIALCDLAVARNN
ncbi:MAG: geranylgeranyl pyrophosphate synthase [Gammaproteobacteria bacterium]|nr:geranylgeranyl pyrophosphate synthase [Gammaproteobacteria bacterium]